MIEYGGHDLVTTAPAATTEPLPIVTPFNIVTLAPVQTSSSIQQRHRSLAICHWNP